MAKVTFVVISVSDRVQALNGLIESIMSQPAFKDYDINLLFQDYTGKAASQIKHRERYANIFVEDRRLGCHGARVMLLRKIKYDVYINMDDDMLVGPYTRYDSPIQKVLAERDCGFVLTNWARTQKLLLAKVPKMREHYVPQALVYQGGGMLYNDKVADIVRTLNPDAFTFDTIQPLTVYLKGYRNYRYLGSLAVHEICGKGGMRAFMDEETHTLPCAEFVYYEKVKNPKGGGRDYKIPMDANLKPAAKTMHRVNNFSLNR